MLSYYKSSEGRINRVDHAEDGCWINVVAPAEGELATLSEELRVDRDFVSAALDEEETSRVETRNGQCLVVLNVPAAEKKDQAIRFFTVPVGVVVTDRYVVTVCQKETAVLSEFSQGLVQNVQTNLRTRFVLCLLMRMAARFQQYLRQIDKISNYIEKQLRGSMRRQELIQLLDLKKALVYFAASLRADELTIEKILQGKSLRLYEEDRELFEGVIVEVRQAAEMANVSLSILTGTMAAFDSVVTNNLGHIMKTLTSVIILLAIPAIVFSFYGMNISLPIAQYWFPLALTLAAMAAAGGLLYKKKMF